MPNQTDHILSYLPRTFQALPKPTALYSVAAAFGNELLTAENSLVDVMRAHWVDSADKDAELLRDLACLASLYGLVPRGAEPASAPPACPPLPADESIEEFREHLKRYIRTFLDGTVTVQGITRIVAEALGLHVADDYAAMDTWWTRPEDVLVSREPHGADATTTLFGFEAHTVIGSADQSASITGSIDLSKPIDLSGSAMLRLKIDNAAPVVIDLASHLPNTAAATLDQIVSAIDFLAHQGNCPARRPLLDVSLAIERSAQPLGSARWRQRCRAAPAGPASARLPRRGRRGSAHRRYTRFERWR